MRNVDAIFRQIEDSGLDRIDRAKLAGRIMNAVDPDTPTSEAFAAELEEVELGELVMQLGDIEANR